MNNCLGLREITKVFLMGALGIYKFIIVIILKCDYFPSVLLSLTSTDTCSFMNLLREGTFFLGEGGGLGPQRGGSSVKVSAKRRGPYLIVRYSREGHTSFPEFFNKKFCDDAFHFSYRLSFSFHVL